MKIGRHAIMSSTLSLYACFGSRGRGYYETVRAPMIITGKRSLCPPKSVNKRDRPDNHAAYDNTIKGWVSS